MQRSVRIALLAILVSTFVACDTENDETYADIIVGDWTPYFIGDPDGEKTVSFLADVDEFTFRFRNNQTFTIFLDFNASGEAKGYTDVGLDGSFTITEAPTLQFHWHFAGTTPTLDTGFNFSGRDIFNFSGDASAFHAIIGGPELTGVFEVGLERL